MVAVRQVIYHTIFIGIAARGTNRPWPEGFLAFAAVAAKQWFSSTASILDMKPVDIAASGGRPMPVHPRAYLSGKQMPLMSELTLL